MELMKKNQKNRLAHSVGWATLWDVGLAIAVIAWGSMFFSCATIGIPLERAEQVGLKLSAYYQHVHAQALVVYESGSEETRAWMREKVNPVLNEAKEIIVDYLLLVRSWKLAEEIGPPPGLTKMEHRFLTLISTVLQLINNPKTGGGTV